jgi:hypothetical protein
MLVDQQKCTLKFSSSLRTVEKCEAKVIRFRLAKLLRSSALIDLKILRVQNESFGPSFLALI